MIGFSDRRAAGCRVAALCLLLGGCAQGSGRTALASGYAALLAAQDRDGDGRLDRGEVTRMVEAAFPPGQRTGAAWDALRAWLVALYFGQDRDGDGRLSLGELLHAPLATFDCVDADGDGQLSRAEIEGGVVRCAAPVPAGDGGPGFEE